MRKLLATMIILLLAGWIYPPCCLAEQTTQPTDLVYMQTVTSSESIETNETTVTSETTVTNETTVTSETTATSESIETITLSIPSSKLKKDGKSKLILIKKGPNGKWNYDNSNFPVINYGWILLVFVAVFSLVVNCIIIFFKRKGY